MFCMCNNRGCVVTGESNLCHLCVLTEDALLQRRIINVVYVY